MGMEGNLSEVIVVDGVDKLVVLLVVVHVGTGGADHFIIDILTPIHTDIDIQTLSILHHG